MAKAVSGGFPKYFQKMFSRDIFAGDIKRRGSVRFKKLEIKKHAVPFSHNFAAN